VNNARKYSSQMVHINTGKERERGWFYICIMIISESEQDPRGGGGDIR